MKMMSIFVLLLAPLIVCADVNTSWFPPFADDVYALLSGIWSEDIEMAPGGRLEHFSWGDAPVWPNDSRIIDLRADAPFLLMEGGYFEIVSIDSIELDRIRINVRLMYSKADAGYIVAHLQGEDRMQWENHLSKGGPYLSWFEKPLYRHYGPRKPAAGDAK
jgi:hypothetical protein